MNVRALPRRALPYLIAAAGGFLLAYTAVFLFAFPAQVLPDDGILPNVVGKTYETGLRGTVDLNPGRVDWKLGVFRTDTSDDILRLASVIQGRGFFTNVAATRRQGLEAGVEYRAGPWTAYAGYSFDGSSFGFLRSPSTDSSTSSISSSGSSSGDFERST